MTLPVILVHGFGLGDTRKSAALYRDWSAQLLGHPTHWFQWDSGRPPPWGHLKAVSQGYWNSYAYAYRRLAVAAQHGLQDLIEEVGECNILCHSLGSRVALLALHGASSLKVRRVLILNGAESVERARVTAPRRPGVQFYNAVVENDPVLSKLAANFTPGGDIRATGHAGMGDGVPLPNWTDIPLPDSCGHWDSYENAAHWDIWRRVLDGASV